MAPHKCGQFNIRASLNHASRAWACKSWKPRPEELDQVVQWPDSRNNTLLLWFFAPRAYTLGFCFVALFRIHEQLVTTAVWAGIRDKLVNAHFLKSLACDLNHLVVLDWAFFVCSQLSSQNVGRDGRLLYSIICRIKALCLVLNKGILLILALGMLFVYIHGISSHEWGFFR
jgi:hypothetical protein